MDIEVLQRIWKSNLPLSMHRPAIDIHPDVNDDGVDDGVDIHVVGQPSPVTS